MSNSNDALVAVLVLAALWFAGERRPRAGRSIALAGLTKFAPLVLAPLFATYPGSALAHDRVVLRWASSSRPRWRSCRCVAHNDLRSFWDASIAFQAERGSPFSIWGLYEGAGSTRPARRAGAGRRRRVVLALVPRRRDVVGLAALSAAILIALQLGVTHWFYLYIPWFFPLVMLALLGRFGPVVRVALPDVSAEARVRLHLGLSGLALAALWASRRPSARPPTRRSTTSSSTATTRSLLRRRPAALPRLRLRVPAAGGAADRARRPARRRRADVRDRSSRSLMLVCALSASSSPRDSRAAGARRSSSPGCWRSRRCSSAPRCARTSTSCRSRSRSARCWRSPATGRGLGFALLGIGTMTKLFPGLLAVARVRLAARRAASARRRCVGGAIFAAVVVAISLPFASNGLRRLATASTSTARCRSSRRRRRVLFALGGSDVTGTNLRPDRFKSNGLDGGHADVVDAALHAALVLALACRSSRSPRAAATRATSSCAASRRCWRSWRSARSSRRSTSSGWRRSPRSRGRGASGRSLR